MTLLNWLKAVSKADFLKCVGLYITPDRLIMVRLRKDFLRLSLMEAEMRSIRGGNGGDSFRRALSQGVRSLLPHFDPDNDPVYLCLSTDKALSVPVQLPQVAEEDLARVLSYEMERFFPFRRDDLYYDFLRTSSRGNKLRMYLFASPKRALDEVLEVLAGFGIRPKGVETAATAVANFSLFAFAGEPNGARLIMGRDDSSWNLVGIKEGNGGRGAPEMVCCYQLPKTGWARKSKEEILQSHLRESGEVFRWGEGEKNDSLVEVSPLKVKNLMQAGGKRLRGSDRLPDSFFIPALGAALRGLREAAFGINLLSTGPAEKEIGPVSTLNLGLIILLLLGLVVWGGSHPVKDEIRLRQLKTEVEKIAPSVRILQQKEDEVRRYRQELDVLANARDRRGQAIAVLDELSRIVPPNSYLSSVRIRGGDVEIRGSAENASSLVPILEGSALFQNVSFNAPSNRGQDNRETFSLKANLANPGRRMR